MQHNELEFYQHMLPNGDYIEWDKESDTKTLFSGMCDACMELNEAQAYNLIRGFTSSDAVFSQQ